MYKNSLFIFTNLKIKKNISTKNLICIKKNVEVARSLIPHSTSRNREFNHGVFMNSLLSFHVT